MNPYLEQLEDLLFSEDASNIELAMELAKTLDIDTWPLYQDLRKCSEFFNLHFRIKPNVRAMLEFLHRQKGSLRLHGLDYMPSYLYALKSLVKELILASSGLSQLPEPVCHFSALQHLDLSQTKIAELPADFCRLQQLQKLNLANGKLYQLPADFGQLRQLETLVLSNPSRAPLQLGTGWTQLKGLKALHYNAGELLPNPLDGRFFELPNLKTLTFGHTAICDLPAGLSKFKNLEHLRLYCPYLEWDRQNIDLLAQLPSLQTLHLSSPRGLQQLQASLPHLQISAFYMH